MTKHLRYISIQGYKSIYKLENLALNSLNIFIGANGSGKTNFISVFKLLNQIIDENLQLYIAKEGGADNLLHFGQKQSETLELSLSFSANKYDISLTPASSDTLIFGTETVSFYSGEYTTPYTEELGSGHRETHLVKTLRTHKERTVAYYVFHTIKSWKVYHFHDTSKSAKVKQQGNINDNENLRADASNLAAFLYLLREKNNGHYQKIVSTIQMVAPFFDDFNLRPNPLNEKTIRLEWREKGADFYFDANALSDGTLRFICLATLLLQPNLPATILIDEPELGLHPYAITVLAALIQSAAEKTQVIISTQSVPLVNQFGPEDIIVVDRVKGKSTFRHLQEADLENWLDDYGMGDLWEKNLLGGRPR